MSLVRRDPRGMTTWHEFRRVFVHIPRTAGRSIIAAMRDQMSDKLNDGWGWPHAHDFLAAPPRYPAFTFVRNPWDRVASVLANQGRDWHALVGDEFRPKPQTVWLNHITDIGRYETLQADFTRITGLEVELPHIGHVPRPEPLPPEAMELIAKLYAEEIDMFGYQMPEAPPAA